MYYVMCRSTLSEEWVPVLNPQDETRLTFVSINEASDGAADLAKYSEKQFMAVDEKSRGISLIYTGKNPYEDLI